jgi:hypothetical protein
MIDEYKDEKIRVRRELKYIDRDIFIREYESQYDTEIIKTYKEKKIKEKLVMDRRIVMETTLNYYIP